ncbi:ADP-ribosylglycohydrolase family protein [Nanchangia anserum]|uniref:ADP-ribosylglycohydrolase family protein n=1 Tax=Nanchangia anserum TaxID=2692125 RepID=A0A8I0GFC0_9ACTO|nr:ADP-ribosylglycohydrolase family protein [Nanchangia anserum]MBD3689802.1 ADP-ribosylglycohydrolase family protein [Nanchangia anserum]
MVDDNGDARAHGHYQRHADVSVLASTAPLSVIVDRAAATLIGQACGDALGVPYEFRSPRLDGRPTMRGGGVGEYEPGEWSDETQLAICLAEVAATGVDLTLEETLDDIATRYIAAVRGGVRELDAQTRVVFDSVLYDDLPGRPAQKMRRGAAYFHRRTQRSAGNGALARTPIIGMTRIHDRRWTAAAARTIAELTHVDPIAGDACVLATEAIRAALVDPNCRPREWRRRLHLDAGLDLLPPQRRVEWRDWLNQAAQRYFKPPLDNSFTVTALQAAIGAIIQASTSVMCDDPTQAFTHAVEEAVRVGGDTDTIASMTGALMGAVVGTEAIPPSWRSAIHGWPGLDEDGLYDLAVASALAGVLGPESMSALIHGGDDLRGLVRTIEGGFASTSTSPDESVRPVTASGDGETRSQSGGGAGDEEANASLIIDVTAVPPAPTPPETAAVPVYVPESHPHQGEKDLFTPRPVSHRSDTPRRRQP